MATLKGALLRHTATLKLPASASDWQTPQSQTATVLTRVHVQRRSGMNVNSLNQEVQTQACLWYDAKLSAPHGLDFMALKAAAEAAGAALYVVYEGHEYSVTRVVECLDGFGRVHHYEVEMV